MVLRRDVLGRNSPVDDTNRSVGLINIFISVLNPWEARQLHVGEDAPLAGDGLHREALPMPAPANLVGDETTERDPGVAQQGEEAPRHRGLADPWAAFQQQPEWALLVHVRLLDDRHDSAGPPSVPPSRLSAGPSAGRGSA
jgi:hypothetical protein